MAKSILNLRVLNKYGGARFGLSTNKKISKPSTTRVTYARNANIRIFSNEEKKDKKIIYNEIRAREHVNRQTFSWGKDIHETSDNCVENTNHNTQQGQLNINRDRWAFE